jgi:hypothetical protein
MTPTLCPSAPANAADAQVFAVIGGSPDMPEVQYLDQVVPLSAELAASVAPAWPTEVFRLSSACAQGPDCWHFDEARSACRLAIRTVRLAPVAVHRPPRCAIRAQCQWWAQEGVSGCLRCPQVVTNDLAASALYRRVADPFNHDDAA